MPDSSKADAIRTMVLTRLGELGLDQSEVSERLGKNTTYINQYVKKKSPVWLPEDVRPRLATILGISEAQLKRPDTMSDAVHINISERLKSSELHQPDRPGLSKDKIQVLGMAECGPDGWALWNGDVVDWAERPSNLVGVPKAYAVFIVGESMEPRYHPSELAFIHPGKPILPGAYVLVQMHPPEDDPVPRAFLKRLVRRSGDKVVLEQYNPPKTFTLKAKEIKSMHRVVGSGEP
jgi:phage repressor protein C with HTH and peptisase S24 domain